MHKVCIITATRAEYGIFKPLLAELSKNKDIDLQIIATGTHLSNKYGHTIDMIMADGFKVNKQVDILDDTDSSMGIIKTMSRAQLGIGEALTELQPELVVVLGDRYELIPIVSSAVILNIPVCHIHGGEISEGALDDMFRHAVTKMSTLHFPACEEYRNNLLQMGENPAYVFNYGSLGVENVNNLQVLSRKEISEYVGFSVNKHTLLVTFHPITTESDSQLTQFMALLDALNELDDSYSYIFTRPNSDQGREELNNALDSFATNHKCFVSESLGMLRYLSAMKYCGAVVGNSSSGIIEAPSFKVATIDIGNRQKGRTCANSVIHVPSDKETIKKAIKEIDRDEYQNLLQCISNPYEGENTSKKMAETIYNMLVKGLPKTKPFYKAE